MGTPESIRSFAIMAILVCLRCLSYSNKKAPRFYQGALNTGQMLYMSVAGLSLPYIFKYFLSRLRAIWMRVFTVPIGMFSSSAISWYL